MIAVARNGVALILFGGARLTHGVGDGVAFMLLGLAGLGIAVWGIARVSRI